MSGHDMRKLMESVIIENESSQRLTEIKDEIKNLMHEAREILQYHGNEQTLARAKAYWYGHIVTALDNDNEYMGGSMTTMQDTIDEMGGKGTMEEAVMRVESYMNEENMSLEQAVADVSEELDANYNELMVAVQQAMGQPNPN